MSTSDTTGLVCDLAGLADHIGEQLGHTPWREMTQERVNLFADATDDHQFIHVDPEKAQATPFGGTIAHGFLTLSLVAAMLGDLITVTDVKMGLNYGLDKVRFPAPLPVGSRFRGGVQLVSVDDVPGGKQAKAQVTIEVQGQEKPAMVAECLVRFYG
ncbi:MAG TPA: MaoC family dehydratase [Solirubrobacteraceae bacterium]|nr:MaoC family dehydratase [Solirubrobacteraceae bacterium]